MHFDPLNTPATWDVLSKTGQAYFDALVEHLTRLLGVTVAFVVEAVDPRGHRLCPVAVWGTDKFRGSRCYDAHGTPCERIGRGASGIYPDRLAERFPLDGWLPETGMQSYVALAIQAQNGNLLGHLGVLDDRAMEEPQAITATLECFLPRCRAELLRAREDRGLLRITGRHAWALYRAAPPGLGAVLSTPDGKGFLGYTMAELAEHEDLRYRKLHKGDRQRVLTTVADALKNGQDFVIQYRLWNKDGTTLHRVQDYGYVERDRSGDPCTIVGVLIDVTDRRTGEDAEAWETSEILERLGDLPGFVFRCRNDSTWTLEHVGGGARALTGYTPLDLVQNRGACYTQLVHPDDRAQLEASRRRALSARTGYRVAYRLHDADHRERHLVETGRSICTEGGQPLGVAGFVFDHTECEQALSVVRGSQSRFQDLFDQAADGLLVVDPVTGRIVEGNRRLAQLLGCPEAALTELSLSDIHPDEGPADVLDEFRRLAEQDRGALDISVRRQDGTHFMANVTAFSVHREGDCYLVGAYRDISDRARTEEALVLERETLRQYLDNAPVMTVILDAEGKVRLINRHGCDTLGYAAEEIIGKNWFEQFAPLPVKEHLRNAHLQHLTTTESCPKPLECGVLTREGQERLFAWHSAVLRNGQGEADAVLFSGADVTDCRRVQQDLRTAQGRLEVVVRTVPAVLYACQANEDLPITFIGDNLREHFGLEPDEFLGRSGIWLGRAHPADIPHLLESLPRLRKSGNCSAEFRLHLNGKGYRWVECALRLVRDGQGQPLEVAGYLLDIDGRKQAEKALQEREANLAHAQAIANLGSWESDLNSGKETWSDEFYRILGYAPRAFPPTQERLLERLHAHDLVRVKRRMVEALRDETGLDIEFRVLRPSGEVRHVRARSEILRDEQGKGTRVTGTLLDITERKRFEETLDQSSQTLRELAEHLQSVREEERTAVAQQLHDELGQSLTALKIDMVRLRARIPNPEPVVSALVESMLESIGTTIETVQRVMEELRPSVLDHLGLIPAVEWQMEQFERRTGIHCNLNVADCNLGLSREASTALFRILQESLSNVAHHASAHQVRVALERQAGWLNLTISDDGKGISKLQVESNRSFGLLGMRERAQVFGGQLEIQGKRGEGTTVRVRIPARAVKRSDERCTTS